MHVFRARCSGVGSGKTRFSDRFELAVDALKHLNLARLVGDLQHPVVVFWGRFDCSGDQVCAYRRPPRDDMNSLHRRERADTQLTTGHNLRGHLGDGHFAYPLGVEITRRRQQTCDPREFRQVVLAGHDVVHSASLWIT